MILTNRSHRILFMALAGMEVGWFLPFLITLITYWQNPLVTSVRQTPILLRPFLMFGLLWSVMLLYMLAADLLNRSDVSSPARELSLFGLVIVTGLLSVLLVHRYGTGTFSWEWLGATFQAVYDFTEGIRAELLLILINTYLWFRVSVATDRDLSFLSVGMSFRIGLLLAILGNALLTTIARQPDEMALTYFSLFFVFGLTAVALARIDQKAVGAANSTGALLPWSRLLQLIISVCATVGIALGLTLFYNPTGLRRFLSLFAPVWSVMRWVLLQIIFLIFLALSPLLERLALLIGGTLGDIPQQQEFEFGPPVQYQSITEVVREWTALRYCLVTGTIVLVFGFIWLFFLRTRFRPRSADDETTSREEIGYGGGLARAGLGRLSEWLNLLRRYGFSQALLAAVSVQNMYANLGRVARKRGYARRPAQPPDDYLPALEQAFPDNEASLSRLTAAYMRVHYGDQQIGAAELAHIENDYRQVLESPQQTEDSGK